MVFTIEEGCEHGGGMIFEIHDCCDALETRGITPEEFADAICEFLNDRAEAHGLKGRVAYHNLGQDECEPPPTYGVVYAKYGDIVFAASKPNTECSPDDPDARHWWTMEYQGPDGRPDFNDWTVLHGSADKDKAKAFFDQLKQQKFQARLDEMRRLIRLEIAAEKQANNEEA